MDPSVRKWIVAGVVTIVTVGGVAACVTDHFIYESTQFHAPPSNAGGFVGYANVSTRMTVCGDCHIARQTTWIQTAHHMRGRI